MKVMLFGATGMVGQGVLRECLLDPGVERVLSVTRRSSGAAHAKRHELVPADFFDLTPVEPELAGYDACFFCLGVSSLGMSEAEYTRLTYDLTMAAARSVAKASPDIAFTYVSGVGTDSTERGRTMWARVKGRTENALLALLPKAFMFRPGYIQPMHGVTSRAGWVRGVYAVAGPLFPALRALFPTSLTTTEEVGRAMLRVAREGAPKRILEPADIVALGRL